MIESQEKDPTCAHILNRVNFRHGQMGMVVPPRTRLSTIKAMECEEKGGAKRPGREVSEKLLRYEVHISREIDRTR
jgi:hypothetical protein